MRTGRVRSIKRVPEEREETDEVESTITREPEAMGSGRNIAANVVLSPEEEKRSKS